MIAKEQAILNPYRAFLNKVKEGKINPLDVRIDLIVEDFKIEAEMLENEKMYRLSAMFIQAVSKLIKLKTDKALEYLFPIENKKRIRITKQEVEEILKEFDVDVKKILQKFEDEGLNFENYNPYRAGGKAGGKGRKKKKILPVKSFKDFIETEKPFEASEILFDNTDYNEYAKEIREKIEKGTFKIKSYKDFIGLMFAIYNFGLEIDDVRKFI